MLHPGRIKISEGHRLTERHPLRSYETALPVCRCRLPKLVLFSSPSPPRREHDTLQKASGPSAQVPDKRRSVGRTTEAHTQPLKCGKRGSMLLSTTEMRILFLTSATLTDTLHIFPPTHFAFTTIIMDQLRELSPLYEKGPYELRVCR